MLRSTDLRQPGIAEKLTAFLTLFGQLGQEAPPPVLCVAIVRWDDGDPPLAEAEPVVSAAFAQARAAGMIAIDPVVTLSMCDASHFDAWQYTIAAYDKNNEIDLKKLEQLKRSFNAPFRLSALKARLEQVSIYK
jgi:hypothetical protein